MILFEEGYSMDENNIPQQTPEQEVPQQEMPQQEVPQQEVPQQNIPPQQPYAPTVVPPAAPGAVPGGKSNNAMISLILGVVSIVASFIPYIGYVGWIVGIVGIVFAIRARNEIPVGGEGRGMATAGLVLSIIAICLTVISFLCVICVAAGVTGLATALY